MENEEAEFGCLLFQLGDFRFQLRSFIAKVNTVALVFCDFSTVVLAVFVPLFESLSRLGDYPFGSVQTRLLVLLGCDGFRFQFGDTRLGDIEGGFEGVIVSALISLPFPILYLFRQRGDLLCLRLCLSLEFDVLLLLLFQLVAQPLNLQVRRFCPLQCIDGTVAFLSAYLHFLLRRFQLDFDLDDSLASLFDRFFQRADALLRLFELLSRLVQLDARLFAMGFRPQQAQLYLGMLLLPLLDFHRAGFSFLSLLFQLGVVLTRGRRASLAEDFFLFELFFQLADFLLCMAQLTFAMRGLVAGGLELGFELLILLPAPFARLLRIVLPRSLVLVFFLQLSQLLEHMVVFVTAFGESLIGLLPLAR